MPEVVMQYDLDESGKMVNLVRKEEIVRCKDCKHWLDINDGRQKHRMCADIYGDWYCADAERRTDG